MTDFISTRAASAIADGAQAVQGKPGADGGLLVPQSFAPVNYAELSGLDYAARAEKILRAYFPVPRGACAAAFSRFDGDPAPVVKLDDNVFLLELSHGMSLSVDDMSVCVMPALLGAAGDRLVVPVATHGELGGSIVRNFADAESADVAVMYDLRGITGILRRALTTARGNRLAVAGVDGDISRIRAAVDGVIAGTPAAADVGSANIARVLAQTAYYFSAYCDLVNNGEIGAGERIDFVIPLGGFDHALAGYYAYKMGLPVNKLVCASEYNDSLCDFITTGVYDVNAEEERNVRYVTANIERLVFETSGRNAELTAARMSELKEFGRFSVTESETDALHELLAAARVQRDEVDDAIAYAFDEYGYIADPHTAAAFAVADSREYVRPTVILGVSDAFKYPRRVLTALGERASGEEDADMIARLEDVTGAEAPQAVRELFKVAAKNKDVIMPDGIAEYIRGKLG